MNLKELIEREIEFIKERIEEYRQKSKQADSMTMTFYYDGLVVALETMLMKLKFDLEIAKE